MSPSPEEEIAELVDEIPASHGPVGLLSSDEFLPVAEPFDRGLLEAAAGPRIALILAADPRGASKSARLGRAHYRRLGAHPVVVNVYTRDQATAEALPPYDVLFLAGGSPSALLACLRGTPLWDEALRRWRDGRALAGSSAGAMALCSHSLEPEPGARRPTRWAEGLGPIERFALAVHARTAPQEWLDLIGAPAPAPVIALDEGVGLLLQAQQPVRVLGDGRAWVLKR
jgi:cyanophycinase-like exopeptidase